MADLDAALREIIRAEVREALQELPRPEPDPVEQPEESWRSRLWSVAPQTRLSLGEVAEALDVSERSVRRYIDGSGDRSPLPHRRGPTGITVTAGELRDWIQDLEEGQQFAEVGGGR